MMTRHCPRCGRGLRTVSGSGRPAIYCSQGCRRAAEFEIRRVNERLASLETRLSELRVTTLKTGWEDSAELLQAEISVQRARLADLCDEMPDETLGKESRHDN
jgi:hypothetical protein